MMSITTLLALAALTNAHMIMKTPVPYGTPNNSPLEEAGTDYPCKLGTAMTITSMNNMPAGSSQTLSFTGSATHGGGSCQVSLTMDKTPKKDSLFKVIHSIEGGCPASAAGNLGEDPHSDATPKFNFTMPKDMPNGQYSLAWSWFNEIGNREMYMNCAPVTVTGGAPNQDAFNKLPDMFVGNIHAKNGVYDNTAGSCTVKESTDLMFPEPGLSVQTIGTKQAKPDAACNPKGKSGSGSDTASAPAPASGAGAPKAGGGGSSQAAAPADTSSIAPAGPAAAFSAVAPAAAAATPMATPASTPVATPAAAPATDSSASTSGSSSTGGGACPAGSQSCSTVGSVVCIGSGQFGLCDVNMCAVSQPLASGTTCNSGKIMRKRHLNVHRRRAAMPGWGIGGVDEVEVQGDDLIV